MLWIKTFLLEASRTSFTYAYLIGIVVLAIWSTRLTVASILTYYMNPDLKKVEYMGYSILYAGLFLLFYIGLFFIVLGIFVKLAQMVSDKYDAMEFIVLCNNLYAFLHNTYNAGQPYALWFSLVYGTAIILVLSFVLIENSRTLINRMYHQEPELDIENDELDYDVNDKNEGAITNIIDEEEGVAFVYKMNDYISRMSMILFPCFIVIGGSIDE